VAIKRAKTLDDKQFDRLTQVHRRAQHDAGPRPADVPAVVQGRAFACPRSPRSTLTAMTNTEGKIAKIITIFSNVGKGKKPRVREIPMHADIAKALAAFMKSIRALRSWRSLRSRSATLRSTAAMRRRPTSGCQCQRADRLFPQTLPTGELRGCLEPLRPAHVRNETARRANQFHNSLKDVQNLLGHARLDTTENYLEPSEDTMDMVNSL
jgi:site-specific recombinase XerD